MEIFTARTVVAHHFERFRQIDPDKAVLLAANHRSFNDQFTISARLFTLYGVHHNLFFPVRANFFYDNLFGLMVNLFFAYGVMYPPIIRDNRRRNWNQCATEIMVDLLRDPRNMVGIHPEGTRNKGADPYKFLPAKPGCGELVYRARPNVVPVFLQGFPKNPFVMCMEKIANRKHPKVFVHMVMGEPMDFSSELAMEDNSRTYLHISRKIMKRIAELAQEERRIRSDGAATTVLVAL